MKLIAVVVAACLAAACAPRVAPSGSRAIVPVLTGDTFVTADGLSLPVRRWLPEAEPDGVILAVHGFNDYSKAFDMVSGAPGVGPTLAGHGFAVFAYDQRGFGAAPHIGLWPGKDVLSGDFADFARVLHTTYPDLPIYAIGVSMGGAVIIAAMTAAAPPPVDAVVLVAPAVWSRGVDAIGLQGVSVVGGASHALGETVRPRSWTPGQRQHRNASRKPTGSSVH